MANVERRRFRFLGLDNRHRDLTPAEQLARHAGGPLVFELDADARNSWGGHALDPLLLNLVLFDPAALGEQHVAAFFAASSSLRAPRGVPGGGVATGALR